MGVIKNKFVLQTSKDYDMKYYDVKHIYDKHRDIFYGKLEEFIKNRRDE